MAERPFSRPVREIPNFAMQAPWSAPLSEENETGLAMSGLLASGSEQERAISAVLGDFPLRYQQSLGRVRA